jgi:hypothetical protein
MFFEKQRGKSIPVHRDRSVGGDWKYISSIPYPKRTQRGLVHLAIEIPLMQGSSICLDMMPSGVLMAEAMSELTDINMKNKISE